MSVLLPLCVVFLLLSPSLGDLYLHSPRGSNNRLNERSANRNNANRLFDSQNNNRGGYNAGDKTDNAFNNEAGIYYEKYFTSASESTDGPNMGQSILRVEWTNQHGCGGNEDSDPHKLNCNLVMQFMCQDRDEDYSEAGSLDTNRDTIRNGQNTNTQNYNAPGNLNAATRNTQATANRGLHEPFEYYDRCYARERNQGLFVADQNLRTNNFGYSSAIYTRQNPNGNRRGYECPEERDHYPYWHPSPWKDIAVFVQNTTLCDFYQQESHNMVPRGECYETNRVLSRWNNEAECVDNGGEWFLQYSYLEIDAGRTGQVGCEGDTSGGFTRVWASPSYGENPACLILPSAPQCLQAPWSRVNHLGNGRDGVALNYDWVLPHFPSGAIQRCVFRMRYNISTDDYDPWNTDASQNNDRQAGVISPVTQNPNVDIGSTTNKPLRLAINTAQFGRTFQDRTHVFILRPRSQLPTAADRTARIYNLNVRGKRGNIVQTFPAVEYDFVPKRLTITTEDLVHFQWTGSNTHNNGNPAGDGQAGDAGEGTGGTDRTNIVQTWNETVNYPLPWEHSANTMFKEANTRWLPTGVDQATAADLAVYFASSGYYECVTNAECGAESVQTKAALNVLLNNAPASFEGAVLRFTRGTYHYICTRNNNFTNRSQKGRLIVQ